MRDMRESGVEWLAEIPVTWDLVQLGSLFSEHKHKNTGMQSENLLSLSYGNIIRKDINTSDGLLPESFEGYNVIDDGDIVLRLTDLQNDQRSLRVGLCHEKGIVTSAYVTLRKRNPAINSKFYYYLIHSYDVRKGFYGMGAGVRQGLNYAGCKKIMLTLPPADEQERIVAVLDEKTAKVDALIANVQAQIEKLKAYKQSIITEVVTKGLDPSVPMKDSGVGLFGSIPATWSMKKFKHISDAIGDGIHSTPNYDQDGDVFFINGNNIGAEMLVFKDDTNRISEQEFQSYKQPLLTANTIFITLNGATYIKNAFLPYYEVTTLEGSTDLNKVYDLRNKIRDAMLYNFEDVDAFNKFMAKQMGKGQDAAALGRLAGMFKPVIARYMELSEDDRYTVRDYVRKFNKAYAYITQLVRLHDKDLFNEYQYTLHLVKLLPRPGTDFVDINDKIKLEYASLTETFSGAIMLDEKPPVFTPGGSMAPKAPTKKKDTLQSIIDKVNERFSGDFTDADRVIIEGIYQMFMKDTEVKKFRKYAKDNSTEMFVQSLFPDKFRDIVTQCFLDNNDSFAKLFNDPEFYQRVQDAMAQELYKALRKD